MRGLAIAALGLAAACRPEPVTEVAAPGPPVAESTKAAGPETAPRVAASATEVPNAPSIVVHNRSDTGIEIYGAYIVDASGEIGTRMLWPHGSDCPGVVPPPHIVAGGGMLVLPPPTEAYPLASCTPEPLPPGEHVLRLDSGYGDSLYAAAAITLPLAGPVELEMMQHDAGPPCTPELARRAARLAFVAAEADGALPPGFLRGCDPARAACGTLPLTEAMPPAACTITLHERLLRVERAAGDDAPRGLTAWADPEVVYVQRPDITRTSASRVEVDGAPVVIAGRTSHHRHEHGGDAAHIGAARFTAHNPHARPLPLRVRTIEFLVDGQCGLPDKVRARPKPPVGAPTELAPGTHEIVIGFAAQEAYQAHCDRFATRVTFEVEGKRIAATAEHEVMRFEPLRR